MEKIGRHSSSPSIGDDKEHKEHEDVGHSDAFHKGEGTGRGVFDFDNENLSGK